MLRPLAWLAALSLLPSLTWAQSASNHLSARDSAGVFGATIQYLVHGDGIKYLGPARVFCVAGAAPFRPTPWLDRIAATNTSPEGKLLLFAPECDPFPPDDDLSPAQANLHLSLFNGPDSTRVIVAVSLTVAIPDSGVTLPRPTPRQVVVSPGPRAGAVDVYFVREGAGWRLEGAAQGAMF